MKCAMYQSTTTLIETSTNKVRQEIANEMLTPPQIGLKIEGK
jgi:hypothetical protein